MYTERELVQIAKRENNNKRKYLVVNKLQGKHIPARPSVSMAMFHELGELIKNNYGRERLLLIGFAETATAIGASIAIQTGSFYMQTTREIMDNMDYFFFSEVHSHAAEQKLIRRDLESVMDQIDRIVFIEDEVTTGNTIMNIVKLIEKEYPDKVKFSVASILNGMNRGAEQLFDKCGIMRHYLVKTNHDPYEEKAEQVKGDGIYEIPEKSGCPYKYETLSMGGYMDARRLVAGMDYQKACDLLWKQIHEHIDFHGYDKILVLGTEEFMFPAMYTGMKIEEQSREVWFHAVTRSPIEVSREDEYPLHTRYELASVYEKERTTFVYDLDKYDMVLVITDSKTKESSGINGIINALRQNGNTKIYFIRWC